jgi:hypothetical protein
LGGDRRVVSVDAGSENDEADRHLPLEPVGHANGRAFGQADLRPLA